MSSEKATGAVRKIHDTRLRRRAQTLENLPDEVQFENGIAERVWPDRRERQEDISQQNFSSHGNYEYDKVSIVSSKSRTKSNKTSSSLAQRRKKEMELIAEREILELDKKLVMKKLALDKLRLNDDNTSEGDSENSDKSRNLSNGCVKVRNWLKFNDNSDEKEVTNMKKLSRDAVDEHADMNGGFPYNFQRSDLGLGAMALRRQAIDRSLPDFNGNPSEWLVFINEFNETTQLCHYSDSENLIRLRKCLKGDARESVKMLLISHKNVPEIIDTLKTYYGRPELIIKYLIDQVRMTPTPKDYKPETIVRYATSLCNLVNAVKHLQNDMYLKSPLLLEEFVGNLTVNLKQQWAFHAVKLKEVTLLDFSDWLKEVGRASSLICNTAHKNDRSQPHKKSESVLMSEEKKTKNNLCDNCICCEKKKHNLEKCLKFQKMTVNDRWAYVTKNKLCISCLKSNHRMNSCFYKRVCGKNNCKFRHNNLLHKEIETETREVSNFTDDTSPNNILPELVQIHQKFVSDVVLRTIPVNIEGPLGKIFVYALLDEGSTVTLLDNDLANEIGLKGTTEPLCMQWTNEQTQTDNNSQRVDLRISGSYPGAKSYKITDVRTSSHLCLPIQSLNVEMIVQNWPHLKNIPITSFDNIRPKMLIGADNYDLTMPRSFVEGGRYAPKATLTKLGWVFNGRIISGKVNCDFSFHICEKTFDDNILHALVKQSFKLDDHEIGENDISFSRDDEYALSIMKRTTKRVGNRFETGLLWKNNLKQMPESKRVALNRLHCQERKMDGDRVFGEAYCKKIDDYITKGYLKEVGQEESMDTEKTWYLPHFAVFNSNKPDKMRLVFDAAAKSHGLSLNDMLLPGPDLLTPLLNVLWTFRQKKIAFSGDISEMFHQVKVRKEDRSAQRIFWRGFDRCNEPKVFEMQVMTFGATCSPSLAQYVKNQNASEFKHVFPKAALAIINKHYVDDYLDSCDSVDEGLELIQNVIHIHQKGGFHICNWLSNSREIMSALPEDLRLKKVKDFNSDTTLPTERVLGIQWDPDKDEFKFQLNICKILGKLSTSEHVPTKREVLRVVMSIFDPIGFLNNFIVRGRILLQDLWRDKIGWDDKITEKCCRKWKNWLENLKLVSEIRIPRCYSYNFSSARSVQLHVFCDSSKEAYATVVYLRIENEFGTEVSFVSSKCKVCPLKSTTIPRLELQAAVMGCKLANRIKRVLEIKIDETFMWTDSTIVLSWIRSDKIKYKQFVSNRIQMILETSNRSSWRWVPTEMNSADKATRDTLKIYPSDVWLTGPTFLQSAVECWPKELNKTIIDTTEMKKEFLGAIFKKTYDLSQSLPGCGRFSSWVRLIRTTAWILRFVKRCHYKLKLDKELSVDEINEAERLWWKEVQFEAYPDDLNSLKLGGDLRQSNIRSLCPYLDEFDVMRVRSRIDVDVPGFEKHPVILDRKHNFTKLLIIFYHDKFNHQSRNMVMNEIRQKYWITGLSGLVKKIWRDCQKCKNMKSSSIIPRMGNLPIGRTSPFIRPFTFCGLDYFGPFQIKIGRRREKRYGVLFTCLTVRAIHLEIANSLTTDSTILAIQRMYARRGCPAEIFSDNGSNLRGADRELLKAIKEWDQGKITNKLSLKGIRWNFNPPTASHMGGIWERQIRSVKTALKTIMKEQVLHEEVLHTLFLEVENIVNSRPLTDISLDSIDEEALTPNHFLLGPYYNNSEMNILKNFDPDGTFLKKQWRFVQDLSNKFWRRWIKEYLPTLHKRKKWYDVNENLKVNDVVIVVDDQCPRNQWLKGLVVATFPGKDGQVRVADIKTTNGVFRRPVSKLCVLDVRRKP